MKIQKSRDNHEYYSGKLSETTLYSNYTGLALLWLFYSNEKASVFFSTLQSNKFLLWSFGCFILSIALHLIGSLYSCLCWQWIFRIKECAFYIGKNEADMGVFEKFQCWITSPIRNPDVKKIEQKNLESFENMEFHVGERVHIIPYLLFYIRVLACVLGYISLFLTIFWKIEHTPV